MVNVCHSWLCHIDDDMYVNVRNLIPLLSGFDPKTEPIYLGRYVHSQFSHCLSVCRSCAYIVSASLLSFACVSEQACFERVCEWDVWGYNVLWYGAFAYIPSPQVEPGNELV